jgi:glycosyltransferase involved in cell wall biosynthesis
MRRIDMMRNTERGTRVALVNSSVSRRAAGVFEAVRSMAGSMYDKLDYPIQVFGSRDQDTEADRGAWGGVRVRAFDVTGPAAFGFAPGLEGALEAAKPEMIHVNGLWMYPSVAALRWARGARPYMISPHGMLDPWAVNNSPWKKRLAGALYEHRHLRGAACLHALSHSEAEAFRAYGLRNPICVIPYGVEIPAGPAAPLPAWNDNLPKDARVLFYVGRLHPKKGLETLLRGWFDVKSDAGRAGWHLVIAGWSQGGHEQELRALARAQGLDESVHFIGQQFGEMKTACFQAADAFILPSFSEGLPMTVLEAWANGLAVLKTRYCNIPYGFEAGAALQIEPNRESIAEQLRILFGMSDVDRRAIGERGLALVKERHQWPNMAAQMIAVYEWAMGAGPAPSSLVN